MFTDLLPGFTVQAPAFSEELYDYHLAASGAEANFNEVIARAGFLNPRDAAPAYVIEAAERLSFSIFDAVEAAAADTCGVSLNYSSGKDSTLMLSLFIRWMMKRKKAGLPLRKLVVGIADTGSELPAMAQRMEDEAYWLGEFASQENLPIEVFLERPPLKNYLLVEVLGNGKPLPRLTRGGSGNQASEWCMSRVKSTTLDNICRRLEETFPFFVSLLGVRSDESSRREAIIAEYSNGAPRGLCRMGDGTKPQIGCIPIAHWSKVLMRHFLIASIEDASLMPWRLNGDGGAELNRIYREAAGPVSAESATECQLTITKDGSVSNSCSDLSGTRMGCWMCMLSSNKSLSNIAKVNPSHRWLKKFHGYLFGHHRRNFKRIALRDELDFNKDTMFPKGFTFRERYFMTMLLCRTQIESRFTLLTPGMIDMIEEFWAKFGIMGITVADAMNDARKWKQTGKPVMCFDADPYLQASLTTILGLSIPRGAFWLPPSTKGLIRGLELLHLLVFARGQGGDAILPVLMAYVFTRANPADGQQNDLLVMITDTPSGFGTRTNTGLINGLCGAGWTLSGIRQPTLMECRMSDGRTVLYQTTNATEQAKVDKYLAAGDITSAAAVGATMSANIDRLATGCDPEPLVTDWRRQQSEQEMVGKLDETAFKALYAKVLDAVIITDMFENEVQARIAPVLNRAHGETHLLSQTNPDGSAFRTSLRRQATEEANIESLRPLFNDYVKVATSLADALRDGEASIGLLERIAYIVRNSFFDEAYAEEELLALVKRMKVQPAPLPLAA